VFASVMLVLGLAVRLSVGLMAAAETASGWLATF